MIGLAQPAWLFALLLLLPLLRAWHRRQGPVREVTVPALFLWPAGAGAGAPAPAARQSPDPAWRRRALLITLLLLTLAGPVRTEDARSAITVWLDAGTSLLAREADGRRRADHAATALRAALDQTGAIGPVTLRALAAPGRTVPVTGLDADALADVITGFARSAPTADPAPAPALTPPPHPGGRHWLVSDGAGPRVDLPGGYDRVIPVGAAQDNAAVTGLAARRALPGDGPAVAGGDGLLVLVTLHQAGPAATVRTLRLLAAGQELAVRGVRLAAGADVQVQINVPAATAGMVSARLDPADALAEDDGLTLSLTPLAPVPFRQTGPCPAAIAAALAANPRLRPAGSGVPALAIHCGDDAPATGAPTLRLRSGVTAGTAETPLWAAGVASAPTPDPDWRALAVTPVPAGQVLLAAGERPLLVATGPAPRLDLLLDLTDPGPRLPLLLDWLVARLTDTATIGEAVAVTRPAAAVRIAPGGLPVARPVAGPESPGLAPPPANGVVVALLLGALGLALPELRPRRRVGQS